MTDDIFDDFALEHAAKDNFGVALEVYSVIAMNIDVSKSARATVYLTKKKQLMCYVYGPARFTLGDVKKILTRMGLKSEILFPPKGHPQYFDTYGRERFREVFPGRSHANEEDLIYYRTLAPYNPALVQIAEVRDGVIYQADSDAQGGWRPSVKFAYRRIKTS
jgi:hypothetical protein